jgi:hypothetical protein
LNTPSPTLIAGQLRDSQIIEVRDALIRGYARWEDLDELAAVSLDINLETEVGSKGPPVKDVARGLVRLTESSGTTEMLIREAVRRRPKNQYLLVLAQQMGLAPAPFAIKIPAATLSVLQHNSRIATRINTLAARGAMIDADGFEAMVRPEDSQKPGQWRRRMIERERSVCQILLDGDPVGTAFLIAPALLMSNYHVFELPKASGQLGDLARYCARFDYRAPDENHVVSLGTTTGFDLQAAYLDSSPPHDLDYTIVKLDTPRGEDPSAGGGRRSWLVPDPTEFTDHEPTFILQHPRGRTLEMSVGAINGWELGREREVYEHVATTDQGSSGSPCFSWNWSLRALHHRVDPTTGKINRAISLAAILQRMGARGTINLIPL